MKTNSPRGWRIIASLLISIGILVGCGPLGGGQESKSLNETMAAIQATLTQQSNQFQTVQPEEKATQNVELTQLVEQATQSAAQATQAAEATGAAIASASSQTPQITTSPTSDLGLKIKAAKILLYENMSGQKIYGVYHPRYVQIALNMAGYAVTDVGSALGWFRDNLLTNDEWDLIIADSEATNKLSGEYFTYINDHLNRGSAVILEVWDLDEMAGGAIKPILDQCGVALYSDWTPTSTFTLWQLAPDHQLFHFPNSDISMTKTSPFWFGDHGDLLKLTGTGDAQLLLGTMQSNTQDHGTLASCMGGRLLIQTFRDHDFSALDVEALWQNYVYYVLENKFKGQ